VDTPFSGAAAVSDRTLGNIVIAGDDLGSPESLLVSNTAWSFLPGFPSLQIAPGAGDEGDFTIVDGGNNGT
jgi:hypothetical protein